MIMQQAPKPRLGKLVKKYEGILFSIYQRNVFFGKEKRVFEYCQRPTSVSVLAFDEKGRLLMIHEYRHGYKKNVWFLPGGRHDKHTDTPKKAAIRELREETGYTAKDIKLLHKKSPSNTLMWDIYIYVAKNLEWKPLESDDLERIRVEFVPLSRAVKMAKSGEIENEFIAYNIIRFDYMKRNGQFSW